MDYKEVYSLLLQRSCSHKRPTLGSRVEENAKMSKFLRQLKINCFYTNIFVKTRHIVIIVRRSF